MSMPKWVGLAGFLGTSAIGGSLTTYYLFKPSDHKEYSDQITQLNLQLGQIEEKIQKAGTRIVETTSKLDEASSEKAILGEKKKCYEKQKKDLEDYSNKNFIYKGLWPFVFENCEQYNKENKFLKR